MVMRHRRHRYRRHRLSKSYITPSKLTQARDELNQPIPGEYDREELPEALFAPGASEEQQRLSDVTSSKAELFWHQRVEVASTDQIEVPGHGIWDVDGLPAHWPMGTVVTLTRG